MKSKTVPLLALLATACVASGGEPANDAIQIHFLGTAAGEVTRDFNNTATLLKTPEAQIMLDAGDGAYSSLIRQGFRPRDTDAVVVTHDHCDHTLGVAAFAECPNVALYLPIVEEDAAFKRFAPMFRRMHSNLPGNEITVKDVTIKSHVNDHIWMHLPPERLEKTFALSFEIFCKGKRILYSGDLGTLANEVHFWKLLDEPCDLLVMEASHIQPVDRLKVIMARAKARAKVIVFNHVWRMVTPDDVFRRKVQDMLGVPVHVAKDGDWIELSGDGYRYGVRDELEKSLKPIHYHTTEEKRAIFEKEGTPCNWKIIGPFLNTKDAAGNYTGMIGEQAQALLKDAMNGLNGIYTNIDGEKITWRDLGPDEMTPWGLIPFVWLYCASEMVNCAVTDVTVRETGDYTVLWGSDDGCRILVDGREIAYDPYKRGAVKDQNKKVIHLEKGTHRVVIFHDTRRGGFGTYFRIVKN